MKWLVLALAAACVHAPEPAVSQTPPAQSSSPSPILTTDRTLHASLKRIWQASRLWREAIEAVRLAGGRVLVVTPGEVSRVRDANGREGSFDPGVLAEAVPIVEKDSTIPVVVVVVNLRLVHAVHEARLSVPRDVEADLDRILVHEIYGHAVPFLVAGSLSGRCADPAPGQSAEDACAIRRENAVRAEMGLGRRADPGLYSLALALGSR